MDKSAITMTADDDWWLERITIGGKQRYPERIRVGSLDRPRVYVPERTCRDTGARKVYFVCSECGEAYRKDSMRLWHHKPWSYCPNCGARVAREGI